jgi:hypothetical protein
MMMLVLVLGFPVWAGEISFALSSNVDVEVWLEEHSASMNVRSTLPKGRAKILQKRAPHSVLLTHMFRVEVSPQRQDAVHAFLLEDPAVEWVYSSPSVLPPPPWQETPDFLERQEYLLSDPGMDVFSFWSEGLLGNGIRIADIEYGWGLQHEDLDGASVYEEEDFPPHQDVETLGYDDHGTAVLGVLTAVDNGFGCTGIAHHSEVLLFSEYTQDGWERTFAIMRAIEGLTAGDIMLLEMQDFAGCEAWDCLGPAEINPEVWSMTRFAVDAGIVVVAAAGNGSQSLDDGWYEENYLPLGDSGAIIVGAGMSNPTHAWGGLNWGSRIDIQGWGYDVTTLGLETLAELDHDPHRSYTHTFSGTSASSALVAGGIALLQEWSIVHTGYTLNPEGIRNLLRDSGVPSVDYVPHINLVQARFLLEGSDRDQDGFFDAYYGGLDCNDQNDRIHPFAEEDWYDGIDQDCDGADDFDQDGDGFSFEEDCNDEDEFIHEGMEEIWYDGIDQNCDGADDFDQDGDGFSFEEDCNDENILIHFGADEIRGDGIDQNCDGEDATLLGCSSSVHRGWYCEVWIFLSFLLIRVRS